MVVIVLGYVVGQLQITPPQVWKSYVWTREESCRCHPTKMTLNDSDYLLFEKLFGVFFSRSVFWQCVNSHLWPYEEYRPSAEDL